MRRGEGQLRETGSATGVGTLEGMIGGLAGDRRRVKLLKCFNKRLREGWWEMRRIDTGRDLEHVG